MILISYAFISAICGMSVSSFHWMNRLFSFHSTFVSMCVCVCAQADSKEHYKGNYMEAPNGGLVESVMLTLVRVMYCSGLKLMNVKV